MEHLNSEFLVNKNDELVPAYYEKIKNSKKRKTYLLREVESKMICNGDYISYIFEDDNDLFEFKDERYDIPLWLLIKILVKTDVRDKSKGLIEKRKPLKKKSYKDVVAKNIIAAFKSPFTYKQKDILLVPYNTVNVKLQTGKYVNRILSGYIDSFPEKSMIMEGSDINGDHFNPTDYFRYYADIIDLYCEKRFDNVLSATDEKTIDALIEYIKQRSPVKLDDLALVNYKNLLKHRVARFSSKITLSEKLLENIKPKSIIFDASAILGASIELIHVSKKMGIKTSEVQHGEYDKNTNLYFPDSQLSNPNVTNNITDYHLYWGDYYKSFANMPSKVIVVGNNDIDNYRKNIQSIDKCENNILILSNAIRNTSDLAIDIAKALPDYNITYRQHPVEGKSEQLKEKLTRMKNVKLDENESLYDTLSDNAIVVGMKSSVFYQAMALGRYIYHAVKYEDYEEPDADALFEPFYEVEELVYKIKNNICKNSQSEMGNAFFKPNFKENYKNFLINECNINF